MKLTNEIVIKLAGEIGFDLIGFSEAVKLEKEANLLEEWLSAGFQAGMEYMERNTDKRKDIKSVLPGAKSVITLVINYYVDEDFSNNTESGKISRYAWGKDYHLIIWEKLKIFELELKKIDSGFVSKSYVDTGPVMDKAWAKKAGIGWIGKHSNLITREFGSWVFIANVITNIEFEYNEPIPDFCGTCRRCIDACPTNAIVKDYVVDSNKCISYLTIENKNEIPGEFKGNFDNWLFGCDICQDVCPWNKKFATQTRNKEFTEIKYKELNLRDVLNLNQSEFKMKFKESPIYRTKLKGLKRNANFLIGKE